MLNLLKKLSGGTGERVHQLPVGDGHTAAALIDRELAATCGSNNVFLDCRSIPAGVDFAAELWKRLRIARVLLVVIGRQWLTARNDVGHRRIDDPRDWIRTEIAFALTNNLRVIPCSSTTHAFHENQISRATLPDSAAANTFSCVPAT